MCQLSPQTKNTHTNAHMSSAVKWRKTWLRWLLRKMKMRKFKYTLLFTFYIRRIGVRVCKECVYGPTKKVNVTNKKKAINYRWLRWLSSSEKKKISQIFIAMVALLCMHCLWKLHIEPSIETQREWDRVQKRNIHSYFHWIWNFGVLFISFSLAWRFFWIE